MPTATEPLILEDLPCHHCGYNLKTLPQNSRCPECGTLVADTFRHTYRIRPRRLFLGALLLACIPLMFLTMIVCADFLQDIPSIGNFSADLSASIAVMLEGIMVFSGTLLIVRSLPRPDIAKWPARASLTLASLHLLTHTIGAAAIVVAKMRPSFLPNWSSLVVPGGVIIAGGLLATGRSVMLRVVAPYEQRLLRWSTRIFFSCGLALYAFFCFETALLRIDRLATRRPKIDTSDFSDTIIITTLAFLAIHLIYWAYVADTAWNIVEDTRDPGATR